MHMLQEAFILFIASCGCDMIVKGIDKHMAECSSFKQMVSAEEYNDYTEKLRLKKSDQQGRSSKEAYELHFLRIVNRVSRLSHNANKIVYNHQEMINHAEEVHKLQKNKTHPDHVPVHKIYARPGMEKLITTMLLTKNIRQNNQQKHLFKNEDGADLEWAVKVFQDYADVDVNWFRNDWKARFDKYPLSDNLNLMFIYTMRYLQECCAKCGKRLTCKSLGTKEHP